MEAFNIHIL
jgi:hypothetical protein